MPVSHSQFLQRDPVVLINLTICYHRTILRQTRLENWIWTQYIATSVKITPHRGRLIFTLQMSRASRRKAIWHIKFLARFSLSTHCRWTATEQKYNWWQEWQLRHTHTHTHVGKERNLIHSQIMWAYTVQLHRLHCVLGITIKPTAIASAFHHGHLTGKAKKD